MKCAFTATLAFLALTAHAETLDRIAVTVGKYVIAESEIIRDLRIAAFLDGRTPDLSAPRRREAAGRLVDQYLLLEDAGQSRIPAPTEADINSMVEPLRGRYASVQEYQAALKSAGISEKELREHLAAGLRMLRYTDLRFRPEVQYTEQDLREFQTSLARGATPAPDFEQNRLQLEKLYVDQRLMQALDSWLEMVRHSARVVYREAAFQ